MAKTGFWLRGGSAGISTLNSQYRNNAGQGSVLQSGSSHTDPADSTDNSGSNSGSGNSENSSSSPAECGVAISHFCGTIIKHNDYRKEKDSAGHRRHRRRTIYSLRILVGKRRFLGDKKGK